ncbi:hypothetical protein CLV40_10815 [Actinokineospora auranticolor]|uniref:Uncharacterized protein n=1 Tax=Actinokineospora auranticolor TaxID=155976 RepID=A0A2S6GP68_9PSEU|nr:hypothetical protein CLV40_10815 [Actinokineospora auranticolor]
MTSRISLGQLVPDNYDVSAPASGGYLVGH